MAIFSLISHTYTLALRHRETHTHSERDRHALRHRDTLGHRLGDT